MRKVALFLALFFCLDAALDTFDSDCVVAAPAAACHACLCQVVSLMPTVAALLPVAPPRPLIVVSRFETIPGRLTDKSLFQPPKARA
jgi:hypothetical protein